jgi:hypothetical protein
LLPSIFIQTDPVSHPLGVTIKEFYGEMGFSLLRNNPKVATLEFLFNEAQLLSRMRMFAYLQRVVSALF